MSNASDLSFKITTTAELAGAEATARALEMQIGRAKALKQPYEELDRQLKLVNESFHGLPPKLEELHEKEKKASEAAELLERNHHGLHHLFGEMGAQSVPALGHAMADMLIGPLGPAVALLTIIGAFKEAFAGWNESMNQALESNALPQFAAGIKAAKDAFDETNKSIGDYEAALARIALHEVTIGEALANQLTSMKALATERANLAKLEAEGKKLDIDRKAKAGEITPENKVIQNAQADVQAVKDAAAAKRKAEDDEFGQRQAALDKAQGQQAALDKDEHDKAVKAGSEKAHLAKLQADFGADGDKKIDELRKKANDTREELEKDDAFKHYEASKEEYEKNPTPQNKANLEGAESSLNAPDLFPGANFGKTTADKMEELRSAETDLELLQRKKGDITRATTPAAVAQRDADQRAADLAAEKGRKNSDFVDAEGKKLGEDRKNSANTRPIQDAELAQQIANIISAAMDKLLDQKHGADIETGVKVAEEVEKSMRAVALAQQFQKTGKLSDEDGKFLMRFAHEHGANARSAGEASAFAMNNYGGIPAHETEALTAANAGQFSDAEKYLVQLANALGAHVNNVRAAADFVEKLKDDSGKFFDAVLSLSNRGFTAQQQALDALAATVARVEARSNFHQL